MIFKEKKNKNIKWKINDPRPRPWDLFRDIWFDRKFNLKFSVIHGKYPTKIARLEHRPSESLLKLAYGQNFMEVLITKHVDATFISTSYSYLTSVYVLVYTFSIARF